MIPDYIQESVAQKFRNSYPEYHARPKNAALMPEAVKQLVDAGHPFSADTLAHAFNHLDAGGHFEQPEVERIEMSREEMTHASHRQLGQEGSQNGGP